MKRGQCLLLSGMGQLILVELVGAGQGVKPVWRTGRPRALQDNLIMNEAFMIMLIQFTFLKSTE